MKTPASLSDMSREDRAKAIARGEHPIKSSVLSDLARKGRAMQEQNATRHDSLKYGPSTSKAIDRADPPDADDVAAIRQSPPDEKDVNAIRYGTRESAIEQARQDAEEDRRREAAEAIAAAEASMEKTAGPHHAGSPRGYDLGTGYSVDASTDPWKRAQGESAPGTEDWLQYGKPRMEPRPLTKQEREEYLPGMGPSDRGMREEPMDKYSEAVSTSDEEAKRAAKVVGDKVAADAAKPSRLQSALTSLAQGDLDIRDPDPAPRTPRTAEYTPGTALEIAKTKGTELTPPNQLNQTAPSKKMPNGQTWPALGSASGPVGRSQPDKPDRVVPRHMGEIDQPIRPVTKEEAEQTEEEAEQTEASDRGRPAASSIRESENNRRTFPRKEKSQISDTGAKKILTSDESAKEHTGDTTGGSVEDPELQRDANRKLIGKTYRYKEGFGEDTIGVHHGQMAQTLEENPITATAVRDNDGTGVKKVDTVDKLNVTAAGVAQLQADNDQMRNELDKLLARRGRRTA